MIHDNNLKAYILSYTPIHTGAPSHTQTHNLKKRGERIIPIHLLEKISWDINKVTWLFESHFYVSQFQLLKQNNQ